MRKISAVLLLLLPVCLVLTGCGAVPQEREISFFAMDTYMTLRLYGGEEGLPEALRDRVLALEKALSATDPESDIYRLNETGVLSGEGDARQVLTASLDLCRETGGALDLTVYPLVRAWGFPTGQYRVPEAEEIAGLLNYVNFDAVAVTDGEIRLTAGAALDLGATAKGWTGDELAAMLRRAGVKSALLSLGGNVQTVGTKPDGSPWRVAVRDPAGEGYLGILSVTDVAVVTSGGYERYFTDEDGRLWWHILDPKTGCPAEKGLISVTVAGPSGLRCDGLSTALFVMGEAEAVSFWRQHRDFEMLLVTDDGRVVITPDLAEKFTQEKGSTYTLSVIEN